MHLCTVQTHGNRAEGPRCSCGCARSEHGNRSKGSMALLAGAHSPEHGKAGPRVLGAPTDVRSQSTEAGQTSLWCSCGCAQPGTREGRAEGSMALLQMPRPRTWEAGQMGPWYLCRCFRPEHGKQGRLVYRRFCIHPLHSTTEALCSPLELVLETRLFLTKARLL